MAKHFMINSDQMPKPFEISRFLKEDIPRHALTCRVALRRRTQKARRQARISLLSVMAGLHNLDRRFRRRTRQQTLRVSLTAGFCLNRFRAWSLVRIARTRVVTRALIATLFVFAAGVLVFQHRFQWQKAAERLGEKGVLSQLEIAVGAAMLGVIGIVFSLSIFSIQQAAERGTTLTLREYARDWVFRVVFWTLAFFAFLAMLSALQKNEWGLYRACLTLVILCCFLILVSLSQR
jgi:hypothetical protein